MSCLHPFKVPAFVLLSWNSMSLAAKCRLSWARPAYTQVFYSEKLLMVWANYLSSHLPLPLTQLNTNLNVESSFLPTQIVCFSPNALSHTGCHGGRHFGQCHKMSNYRWKWLISHLIENYYFHAQVKTRILLQIS